MPAATTAPPVDLPTRREDGGEDRRPEQRDPGVGDGAAEQARAPEQGAGRPGGREGRAPGGERVDGRRRPAHRTGDRGHGEDVAEGRAVQLRPRRARTSGRRRGGTVGGGWRRGGTISSSLVVASATAVIACS